MLPALRLEGGPLERGLLQTHEPVRGISRRFSLFSRSRGGCGPAGNLLLQKSEQSDRAIPTETKQCPDVSQRCTIRSFQSSNCDKYREVNRSTFRIKLVFFISSAYNSLDLVRTMIPYRLFYHTYVHFYVPT